MNILPMVYIGILIITHERRIPSLTNQDFSWKVIRCFFVFVAQSYNSWRSTIPCKSCSLHRYCYILIHPFYPRYTYNFLPKTIGDTHGFGLGSIFLRFKFSSVPQGAARLASNRHQREATPWRSGGGTRPVETGGSRGGLGVPCYQLVMEFLCISAYL